MMRAPLQKIPVPKLISIQRPTRTPSSIGVTINQPNAPIIDKEPANQYGAFVWDATNGLVSLGDIGWHGGKDNHGRGGYLKQSAL